MIGAAQIRSTHAHHHQYKSDRCVWFSAIQPVRLLVLTRAYQPWYSIFLTQQTSTSRVYQSRNRSANRKMITYHHHSGSLASCIHRPCEARVGDRIYGCTVVPWTDCSCCIALHACAARPDRIHLYRLSTATNTLHCQKECDRCVCES